MNLSDLRTGDKAVIVRVKGYGGFRKRIVEMGFVKGKIVTVIRNAPLLDPIEYGLMNYKVSLRRQEASNIEVISVEEAEKAAKESGEVGFQATLTEEELRSFVLTQKNEIHVALVGNPNAGKTSLFNVLANTKEKVGNYSGVTVGATVAQRDYNGYHFKIADLPGTYSLTEYSPEELYVRKYIVDNKPDVIINVVDAGNLERNLYLTTQLIDMNVRTVIALNMYDELEAHGDVFDYKDMSKMIGMPMVPTIAPKKSGIAELFATVIAMSEGSDLVDENGNLISSVSDDTVFDQYFHKVDVSHKHMHAHRSGHTHGHQTETLSDEGLEKKQHTVHKMHTRLHRRSSEKGPAFLRHFHRHVHQVDAALEHESDLRANDVLYKMHRHVHINYGKTVERCILQIRTEIIKNRAVSVDYTPRYMAIKLLENDGEMKQYIKRFENEESILRVVEGCSKMILSLEKEDAETHIINKKYGFIDGALRETFKQAKFHKSKKSKSERIDDVMTNKYWGYPLFLVIIGFMFWATFSIGQYPMDWIEMGVNGLSDLLTRVIPPGIVRDFLVNGIVGGVGGVLAFLPNILILYFCISFLESSGYMARAAFIVDKIMHKVGLHGRSFIPLVMGFGCNVPAIMATRTIRNRNARYVTILIAPLMSCSARLPLYILIAGTFFPQHAGLILMGLYLFGIVLAGVMALLFRKTLFRENETPFVMELPPYRIPGFRSMGKDTWEKAMSYLKKIGSTILVGSIIIWALSYFPRTPDTINNPNPTPEMVQAQESQSYLSTIGRAVQPVLSPMGYDWKMTVGLISGLAAKEIVVSTMGVLYNQESPLNDQIATSGSKKATIGLPDRLRMARNADGSLVFTSAVAMSFMVFVLIYFPCLATIGAIKQETNLAWSLFVVVYTLVLAWILAYLTYVMMSYNVWQEVLVGLSIFVAVIYAIRSFVRSLHPSKRGGCSTNPTCGNCPLSTNCTKHT